MKHRILAVVCLLLAFSAFTPSASATPLYFNFVGLTGQNSGISSVPYGTEALVAIGTKYDLQLSFDTTNGGCNQGWCVYNSLLLQVLLGSTLYTSVDQSDSIAIVSQDFVDGGYLAFIKTRDSWTLGPIFQNSTAPWNSSAPPPTTLTNAVSGTGGTYFLDSAGQGINIYGDQDNISATISATPTDLTAVAPTPEPASIALLGTGLVGICGFARRRFRRA